MRVNVRAACLVGLALLLAFPVAAQEVRKPPEWKGIIDPPLQRCPNDFLNSATAKVVVICKALDIGEVTNLRPFAPGPWEDKGDPDWAFLKDFWRTGRQIYFAASACDGGDSRTAAEGGARVKATAAVLQRRSRWDQELKAGKFRPSLGFLSQDRKYDCHDITSSHQISLYKSLKKDVDDIELENEPESSPDPDKIEDKANRFTATIKNNQSSDIYIKLFSPARNNFWPQPDHYWILPSQDDRNFTVSCQENEKICYGAWDINDNYNVWGVGTYGRENCKECCSKCGSHATFNINAFDKKPPRDKLKFTFKTNNKKDVYIRLFSSTRNNHVWPGDGKVFFVNSSRSTEADISCQEGEKICYGAWKSNISEKYWGIGQNGKAGCEGCCVTCGNGRFTFTLSTDDPFEEPRSSPPAVAESGDGSDVAGAISGLVDGLAAGAAIGSILGGIRTAPPPAPRAYSPAPYNPGRTPRQSGVSR